MLGGRVRAASRGSGTDARPRTGVTYSTGDISRAVRSSASRCDAHLAPNTLTQPTGRAGLPTTRAWSSTLRVTTEPAPIIAHCPIVTPVTTTAPAPIAAPRATVEVPTVQSDTPLSDPSGFTARGTRSLVKIACGPTKTPSASRTPLKSDAPFWILQWSPTATSTSTKTLAPIVQSRPTREPVRRCARAQTRVPEPTTAPGSTSAVGWTTTSAARARTVQLSRVGVRADTVDVHPLRTNHVLIHARRAIPPRQREEQFLEVPLCLGREHTQGDELDSED